MAVSSCPLSDQDDRFDVLKMRLSDVQVVPGLRVMGFFFWISA
jgi:hypothetical protein